MCYDRKHRYLLPVSVRLPVMPRRVPPRAGFLFFSSDRSEQRRCLQRLTVIDLTSCQLGHFAVIKPYRQHIPNLGLSSPEDTDALRLSGW